MKTGQKSPLANWVGIPMALLGAGAALVCSFPLLGWFLTGGPVGSVLFGLLAVCAAGLSALPGVLVGVAIDRAGRRG